MISIKRVRWLTGALMSFEAVDAAIISDVLFPYHCKMEIFRPSFGELTGLPPMMEEQGLCSKLAVSVPQGDMTIRRYDIPQFKHAVTGKTIPASQKYTVELIAMQPAMKECHPLIMASLWEHGLAHLPVFSDPSRLRISVDIEEWDRVPQVVAMVAHPLGY